MLVKICDDCGMPVSGQLEPEFEHTSGCKRLAGLHVTGKPDKLIALTYAYLIPVGDRYEIASEKQTEVVNESLLVEKIAELHRMNYAVVGINLASAADERISSVSGAKGEKGK